MRSPSNPTPSSPLLPPAPPPPPPPNPPLPPPPPPTFPSTPPRTPPAPPSTTYKSPTSLAVGAEVASPAPRSRRRRPPRWTGRAGTPRTTGPWWLRRRAWGSAWTSRRRGRQGQTGTPSARRRTRRPNAGSPCPTRRNSARLEPISGRAQRTVTSAVSM